MKVNGLIYSMNIAGSPGHSFPPFLLRLKDA